jgi:hypothetical protein
MFSFATNWPDQIVGFFVGIPVGVLANWTWAHLIRKAHIKKLQNWYGAISGSYENIHDKHGPTGGWIQISQNPDGSFTVIGMHINGKIDWTGDIHMSLRTRNIGVGHYRHPRGLGIEHGVQTVNYYPETGELHVRGRSTSANPETQFFHTWRPLPHYAEA